MHIPRGKIHAKIQSAGSAGVRHLLHNIAVKVRVLYTERCVFTGPQTKTVVVLTGKNDTAGTGSLHRAHPLLRLDLLNGEVLHRFFAAAPLPLIGSIHAKVHKAVKRLLCQVNLVGAWHHANVTLHFAVIQRHTAVGGGPVLVKIRFHLIPSLFLGCSN